MKMNIPTINYRFCCSLRTGSSLIAIINLLFSTVCLTMAIWNIINHASSDKPLDDTTFNQMSIGSSSFNILVCLITVAITRLLIHGVWKQRSDLLLPYIIVTAVDFLVMLELLRNLLSRLSQHLTHQHHPQGLGLYLCLYLCLPLSVSTRIDETCWMQIMGKIQKLPKIPKLQKLQKMEKLQNMEKMQKLQRRKRRTDV